MSLSPNRATDIIVVFLDASPLFLVLRLCPDEVAGGTVSRAVGPSDQLVGRHSVLVRAAGEYIRASVHTHGHAGD